MKPDKEKIKKSSSQYLKYSGLAFQLAGIILFSIYIGGKLDAWMNLEKPILTAVLLLVMFTGFIYKLYLDLTKDIH